MTWTRRLAVSTGLAVAAIGIAVPLSLGTAGASATVDPAASVMQVQGGHLAPALKHDLRAAWAKPDGQRVAALQAVLQKAVAGDYGSDAQKRAQRVQQRLTKVDATLLSDLHKAIELSKDQRQAALKQIRQKIRDGGYGDQAKRDAKLLRQVRQHRLFG